jgi:hypothetical protein
MKPPADLFDDLPFAPPTKSGSAAEQFARMADAKQEQIDRRPKGFKLSPTSIAKAKREMDAMADAGAWTSARGVHLVALYSWLHVAIYGVEPAELDGREWALASVLAQRFCATNFEGDFGDCVEFMRWVWKREASREEYRRTQKQSGGRIGWRLQFGAALVTDWRVDRARVSR